MKYKCLVWDHDDTVVNSTAMVHYPCFREYMDKIKLPTEITLEDYFRYNFNPGVVRFFKEICGQTDEQLKVEQEYWKEYASKRVSDSFPGIKEIMEKQRAAGGILAVVSHSFASNILHDYEHNKLPIPDEIFGWEQPPEERKPHPHALYVLMEKYNLKPQDILVIDDLKPGLDMATAAGCDFAACQWCYKIPEIREYMQAHATYCCDSVAELEELLEL